MTSSDKPPQMLADLAWEEGLRFRGNAGGGPELVLDGKAQAGPTPVQALALSLAGCMAIDLIHILGRQRQEVRALKAGIRGWRSEQDPKRFLRIELHFEAAGTIEPDKMERAIALSRDTYCSVWQSLRQDIDFGVSYTIRD